jgi:hypothetical protein
MTSMTNEQLEQLLRASFEALPAPDPAWLDAIEVQLLGRLQQRRRPRPWWWLPLLLVAGTAAAWWGYIRLTSQPADVVPTEQAPLLRQEAPPAASPAAPGDTPAADEKQVPEKESSVIYQREVY